MKSIITYAEGRAMFDYSNALIDDVCTEHQLKILNAYRSSGTYEKTAVTLNLSVDAVSSALRKVRRKANAKLHRNHDCSITDSIPEGYHIKGVSNMITNSEGKPMWVKTDQDKADAERKMMSGIKALCSDIPRAIAIPVVERNFSDSLAVYPLGDPHIGMMSWEPESGADWDINIAKEKFTSVFDRLVKTAPNCTESLIVNLGDYFHADNMEGVTSRSGHRLDLDGRFSKMIEAGMFIMRRMIESALSHHEKVHVINATGNHDDVSSQWLSVALSALYENEPRVNIMVSPAPFQYFEFGSVLIGTHHGHTCKMPNLPGVMAADKPQAWGRTSFRYWLTGHIHHDSMKEYPGVKCESFRTIAAKDAYAAWGGYRAGNDSKCLVMHREHGEIERHTVNLSMV